MKRILIIGENSYVGTSLTNYLNKHYPNDYQIDEISVRNNSWIDKDFGYYDAVLHVAGIAHRKEKKENEHIYYEINCNLAFNVAAKAKRDGVKQFIYLSSMSVYGLNQGKIDSETPTNPITAYGKSKLCAENYINRLNNNGFKVAVIRPPMVYGPNCKGNYTKISKLAKIIPIFPDFPNKRSMVFVDNLTIFLKKIIDQNESGLFLPQNKEYVNTTELVKAIAKINNHKIITTKLFNPIIKLLMKVTIINKVFGNLFYKMNDVGEEAISFLESVKISEEINEN